MEKISFLFVQNPYFGFLFILRWLLNIVIIGKPSTLLIKFVLNKFLPNSQAGEEDLIGESDKRLGRHIGFLERFLIIIFMGFQQYSAIGFVLTAKSIVRYKQLDKKEFAEYYLIGTLLSILCGIISEIIMELIFNIVVFC